MAVCIEFPNLYWSEGLLAMEWGESPLRMSE